MRRMRLVQAYKAEFMIAQIEEYNFMGPLQHLHARLKENIGHAGGPAAVARSRIGHARQRDFPVPPYDSRRSGLQDRVGVIAHPLVVVSAPVGTMQPVEHRPRPRCGRLDPGKIWMNPHAGKLEV